MADAGYKRLSRPQMFYRKDLGTFLSMRADLSDLADDWLEAAVACLHAKGRDVPAEALQRLAK